MSNLHAAMFDMDGLLIDSELICLESFVSIGHYFDLQDQVDLKEVFLKTVGLRKADIDKVINEDIGSLMDAQVFSDQLSCSIRSKMNEGIPLKNGAYELIHSLHEREIPTGVATSTRTNHANEHLSSTGLLPMLKFVVGGDQVSEGKPNPESYLLLAEKLGVPPQNCAAFEDSDNGTRAAVASGAVVVQVPDLKPPSAEVIALGHTIAPDLLSGAALIGLLD